MKLCLISRYPPFEGGVASDSYWESKYLGEKGIETFVVSNAWESESDSREYIKPEEVHKLKPKNVKTYFTNPLIRNKIINSKGAGLETNLLSLAIEADRKEDFDVIQGNYFFPYGIAAWSMSKFAKKPLVIKNAGSDLYSLRTISYAALIELFNQADYIISKAEISKKMFDNKKIIHLGTAIPPDFNKNVKPLIEFDKPTIGVIGKFNQSKRIKELLTALRSIDSEYNLVFLSDKKGQFEIRKLMNHKMIENSIFLDFIAPWNMPSFYKSLDILFCGEKGFSVKEHFPKIALEAFSCGTCTIISDELYDKYGSIFELNSTNSVIVDSKNPKNINEKISNLLKNEDLRKDFAEKSLNILHLNYNLFISELINIYGKLT